MKLSMEGAFLNALEKSAQDFLLLVVEHQSRADKFVLKAFLSKLSKQSAAQICDALAILTNLTLEEYQNLGEAVDDGVCHLSTSAQVSSPPQRQGTRSRRIVGRKRVVNSSPKAGITLESASENAERGADKGSTQVKDQRFQFLKTLQGCASLVHMSLSQVSNVFQPSWLFPTVLSLHNSLVALDADTNLQDSISGLCELWWRDKLDGNESLIVQCLPFLLSKALAWGRKKDVQRVYSMRHALNLFDFSDGSIEDMRHLLIRSIITPAFLRTQSGRRYISFLFGLNPQLVKELVVIVRSQIPFGRKSILEAYGETLYQAWKSAEGFCLHEIEYTCIQGLMEGALYASSKALGASIRTVLEGFTKQKAQDGVEAMLFRLLEPLLFRALQVANSNVRRNALLLLVDVFPLEDPGASKEEKEALLDKQFLLLEKMLMDTSPELRCLAVEAVCRILRLFWEVIPSATSVKFLAKVVDDMSNDATSNSVRLAVLQGISYLLENPQSHSLLKALLPRLGHLLNDNCLAIRVAAVDLLLVIKGIRGIQFYKVVQLDSLLLSLATDNSPVAQRLARLLLPSYFPLRVPVKEACNRCSVLLKRFPQAGTQFCKWLFDEGAPAKSLLDLIRMLSSLARDDENISDEVRTEILHAVSEVCKSMVTKEEWKAEIGEILTGDILAALISCAPDSLGRSYVLQIASSLPPKNVPKLIHYCGDLVMKCSDTPADIAEVRAVHALVLAWGGIQNLLESLTAIITQSSTKVVVSSPKFVKNLTQPKRGSKRTKSAWPSALDSNASKPDEVKRRTVEDRFVAAVGAAWQIETLISEDETRRAVLGNSQLEEILLGLRELAQNAIKAAGNSPAVLARTSYPASPVLAYMKLYMHIALESSEKHEDLVKETSKGRRGQRETPDSAPVTAADLSDGFETAWEELVGWVREILSEATESHKPLTSPPPSQPKAKHARLVNRRSRQREPLSHLPNNTAPGTGSKVKHNAELIKMVAAVLQTISDSFTLGLINGLSLRRASTCLVAESLEWFTDRFSSDKWHSTGSHLVHHSKDMWICVRVITTHAAKILYLCLRDSTNNLEEGLLIAHSLMDLIAVFEHSRVRRKGTLPVIATLEQWVPDLLIAISSMVDKNKSVEVEKAVSAESGASESSLADGEDCPWQLRPWVAHLARTAYETMAPTEGTPACSNVTEISSPGTDAHSGKFTSKSPGRKCGSAFENEVQINVNGLDFLSVIIKFLRRGHVQVLRDFVDAMVKFAALSFAKRDFRAAIGSLDIISRRLLICNRQEQTGQQFVPKASTLVGLKEMIIEVRASLASSLQLKGEPQRQELELILKLLRIFHSHHSDDET